ncbi:MAG: metalloregulator ArsR/SmtB family transcription factor [Candidatus Acidiferrales bacterium]
MLATSGEVFTALADPTRRALFERLSREGELTVRLLTDDSGVSQPAVSKHLGVLKHSGLVSARHKGRQTHYSARPRALAPLVDWMSQYSRFWHDRFDRLEDLLKRMDQ